MKSKHRHELSQNELAKWLTELPTMLRENMKLIIYVAVVAVLVAVTAYFKFYGSKLESLSNKMKVTDLVNRLEAEKNLAAMALTKGSDESLQLVVTANDLQTAANETKDNLPTALALIKRAEGLRAELHYRSGIADSEAVAAAISEARKSYEKAIELATGNPTLTAAAKFGIGLCEEELGLFEKAKEIYKEIVATAEFEGTIFVVQAEERLETIDDYKRPITLEEKPEEPEEAAQPIKIDPSSIKIVPSGENPAPQVVPAPTTTPTPTEQPAEAEKAD